MDSTAEPVSAIGTELLFENDAVRVWSMALAPGERSPFHRHQRDYLYVYVTPSRITLEQPGELPETDEYDDGFVQYTTLPQPITHQILNVSDQPHRQILVEFKRPVEPAVSSADNGRKRSLEPRGR